MWEERKARSSIWLDAVPTCQHAEPSAKALIPCCSRWWLPGSSLSICDCLSLLMCGAALSPTGSLEPRGTSVSRQLPAARAARVRPSSDAFATGPVGFQQERGLEDFLVDDLDAWRQQGLFNLQQNQEPSLTHKPRQRWRSTGEESPCRNAMNHTHKSWHGFQVHGSISREFLIRPCC